MKTDTNSDHDSRPKEPAEAATRAEEETTAGIDQGAGTAGALVRPTPADDYEANARQTGDVPADFLDEPDAWDRPDHAAILREEAEEA